MSPTSPTSTFRTIQRDHETAVLIIEFMHSYVFVSCKYHVHFIYATSPHILDIMSLIFVKNFYSGDNNLADDRDGGIYANGQLWLQRQHVIGKVIGLVSSISANEIEC